jgi:hypothetical protein
MTSVRADLHSYVIDTTKGKTFNPSEAIDKMQECLVTSGGGESSGGIVGVIGTKDSSPYNTFLRTNGYQKGVLEPDKWATFFPKQKILLVNGQLIEIPQIEDAHSKRYVLALGLGLNDTIGGDDLTEILANIEAKGLISIACFPFLEGSREGIGSSLEADASIVTHLDAIETFSYNCIEGNTSQTNIRARDFYRGLTAFPNFGALSVSGGYIQDIGTAWSILDIPNSTKSNRNSLVDLTRESLRAAIHKTFDLPQSKQPKSGRKETYLRSQDEIPPDVLAKDGLETTKKVWGRNAPPHGDSSDAMLDLNK